MIPHPPLALGCMSYHLSNLQTGSSLYGLSRGLLVCSCSKNWGEKGEGVG